MNCVHLYSDKLVEIGADYILIRNYYFPFGSKKINVPDIEVINVDKPSLFSGKYRYVGTGDFRVWFPPDNRTKREKIFVVKLKNAWWRAGFTVEDEMTVLDLLKQRCKVVENTK